MLIPGKPTSKCPECGSIYLLRQGVSAVRRPKKVAITLSERFLSLLLGALFGLLTFFVWGIAILFHGGPYAGKAAAGVMFFGLKLSLALSLLVGITGFILGQDELARLLGVLWGADKEVNDKIERVDHRLHSVVLEVPDWVAYIVLGIVILGGYGYTAVRL